MKKPFPLRYSLPALLFVLGGTLACALIADAIYNTNKTIEDQARQQLKAAGEGAAARLEQVTPDVRDWKMALLDCVPNLLQSSFYDGANRLVACADLPASANYNTVPNPPADPALLNAARARQSMQFQASQTGDVLAGVFPAGKALPGAVVFLQLDLRSQKDLHLLSNFRRAAMICGLTLLLVALAWFYLNRSFTCRVASLIAATRDLAQGDLTRRASLTGRDEFAELSRAFNQMAAQMQTRTQALTESEERHRRIVETAYEGIFAIDATRRLSFVNRRLAEMLGSTIDAITGRPLEDFLFEEDWAGHQNSMTRRHFSEASRYERRLRRQDGAAVWTIMSSNVLRDAAGNFMGAIGMATDITERRELELQLRKAHRMEGVTQLAGGVAHQFNNILTVILGYAQLLKESRDLGANELEMIAEITHASKRAADLTRQLQLFSRTEPMQCREFNLNQILAAALASVREIVGANIAVELDCDPKIPSVHGDSGRIRQVIENLAANARDVMPRGGRLTLATQMAEVTGRDCERNPEACAGRFVRLSISDTGCGMDDVQLQRIFEPCFSRQSAPDGKGLGLATVYGIVKQHNGWIDVASKVDQGTRFAIFLPADIAPASGEASVTLPPMENGAGRKTILLVEDDAPVPQ